MSFPRLDAAIFQYYYLSRVSNGVRSPVYSTLPQILNMQRSEGGLFGAKLEFPDDFPENPPVMTFVSEIWHPNGKSCRLVVKQCPTVDWCHGRRH